MEEAQRLLAVSVWKLYRCRLQRGGLRLHRSLQLSGLVRAARRRYLSAPPLGARAGRKRRSSGSAGPGPPPVPSKRARLEAEEPPLAPGPPGRCSGPPAAAFGLLVRAVGAC
ncbi:LOW QUALITY PROTEIN: immediate early response gene 2 protein [Pelecanus crispus]|uniref:LOW QUALITY PROTEIN: immediate early response gene 2 protein n=1 Tax=Pelecanus crispus TaxID=36300 RepID=UPI003F5D4394